MDLSLPRVAAAALLIACALLPGCGPHLLPPSGYVGQWPTARGNIERSGSVDADLRVPLEAAWKKRVGRGLKGAPVPVGALVLAASTDGRLRALLRETGDPAWSLKIRGGFFAAPVVANRRIYVATEYPDGALYCVDLRRGKVLWRRTTGPVRSTPTVDGGVVYVVADDGALAAYDAVHGRLLRRIEGGALRPQSPLVLDDRLLLFTHGDSLRVISTAEGRVLSGRALAHPPLRAEAAMHAGTVYYPSAEGIVALAEEGPGGEDLLLGGPRGFHVSAAGDLLLGSDGRHTVFALAPPAADPLWTYTTVGLLEAAPIPAGRHAVIAGLGGEVDVLDLRDGRVLWEATLDAPISAPPAVSGRWLFVPLETGEMVAFRSRSAPADGESR